MAGGRYHVFSRWRLRASPEEVWQVISQPEELPRWWPAAYTSSLSIQSGDDTGADKVTRLEGRGFLPYLMRWHVVTTEVDRPRRLATQVWGDLEGEGTWTLTPAGDEVEVEYDWNFRARVPFAGLLSGLLKPLFQANHRWAMRKGEVSLHLEIERRRATTEAARIAVPEAPAGIERKTWAVGAGAGVLLTVFMLRTARRRKR